MKQNAEFLFHDWKIVVSKSHILPSKCYCATEIDACSLCRYTKELTLPHFPDMIFCESLVKIEHKSKNSGIFFNALEALKLVNDKEDLVKVAVAQAWSESRADMNVSQEVAHPFDWTFTTPYKGTVYGDQIQEIATDRRIDMEKLKQKEPILFYDEVHLYEDELADHGCSSCTVKIRVMPSGFFLLHRLYLRVDEVLIRINDTRIHHEVGNDFMLREYSSRESRTKDLKVPRVFWGDPNEIVNYLPITEQKVDKILFK